MLGLFFRDDTPTKGVKCGGGGKVGQLRQAPGNGSPGKTGTRSLEIETLVGGFVELEVVRDLLMDSGSDCWNT